MWALMATKASIIGELDEPEIACLVNCRELHVRAQEANCTIGTLRLLEGEIITMAASLYLICTVDIGRIDLNL
jgi:hypothetical protein